MRRKSLQEKALEYFQAHGYSIKMFTFTGCRSRRNFILTKKGLKEQIFLGPCGRIRIGESLEKSRTVTGFYHRKFWAYLGMNL